MTAAIYLDNNATTPVDPDVLEAMLPHLREHFGNPASSHVFGRVARQAVERARESVATLIGVRDGRIVFTSSATEANNLVIGGLLAVGQRPCHVVSTLVEHKSVLEPLRHLEGAGKIRMTWLRPDACGQVRPRDLEAALRPNTHLVCVMAASNVLHTVNPVADLAAICAARGILFHIDATQYAGRLPLDVSQLCVDALSFSAHKIYGPKGAGALYLSRRTLRAGVAPQTLGGGQEEGLRSGTLNVPAIVGLGRACELAVKRMDADAAHNSELARRLFEGLTGRLGGVTLNGHPKRRIPGGLHLTLAGVDSKGLIASVPEVAFSDGSACESDRDPDYVLKAIGRPDAAHHSIRLQVGRTNTTAEIDAAIELLTAGVERLRSFSV